MANETKPENLLADLKKITTSVCPPPPVTVNDIHPDSLAADTAQRIRETTGKI